MKRFFRWVIGITVVGIMLVALPTQNVKAQPGISVSFQMFYDQLSPYGQWIDDPEYGYVWIPDVGNDFRPYYTNGRWALTEYGNTWISNYNWGWAPFHYGRWVYNNYYGWVWIPGNEWGPAWVSWRSGGGYYGWAPLGPGININISLGNYNAPYDWWTFIPCRYIYSNNYYNYWRGPRYNTTIIHQTTIINNHYNNRYIYGPRRNDIERHTGGRVTVYQIRDDRSPGRSSMRRNEVSIYRPQVERNENQGQRPAPRRVIQAERPINEKRAPVQNNERPNIERGQRSERAINSRNENLQRQQEINRRETEQRNRVERQQVEQQRINQERVQRERVEQQQREQNIRMERQRAEQENRRQMQERRDQQQIEQRQKNMQQQREQPSRSFDRQPQQREWRRPEPQMQRLDRSQPQQSQPSPQRERAPGRR